MKEFTIIIVCQDEQGLVAAINQLNQHAQRYGMGHEFAMPVDGTMHYEPDFVGTRLELSRAE